MDIATIIGIVGGGACIMVSVIFSGGSLRGVFDVPSVFMTIGGSYFSLWLCAPISRCIGIFRIMGRAFRIYDFGEKQIIQKYLEYVMKIHIYRQILLNHKLNLLQPQKTVKNH